MERLQLGQALKRCEIAHLSPITAERLQIYRSLSGARSLIEQMSDCSFDRSERGEINHLRLHANE